MKIETIKEKLSDAVSKAERVTSKNASLKTLSCILLEAKGQELFVRATNLDVGVEFRFSSKNSEEGIFSLTASSLRSFLSNSKQAKEVVLEKKENLLEIKSGSSVGELVLESSEDFPTIPRVEGGVSFQILTEEFLSGIKAVFWAASLSQIKPELSSVYFYEDNDDLVFVATDSFRLAEKRVKTKKIKKFSPILIPFRNVSEIIRILDGGRGELTISANKNQISIETEGVYITSRLIDGNFPDYKQIIPKEFQTKATVLKEEFAGALKLASSFSDKFNQSSISLLPSKKKLVVKSESKGSGEVVEEVLGSFEGEDSSMFFNHKYILEAIPSLNSSSITISMNGSGRPMVIKENSNSNFLYLVMPMNK